MRKFLAPLVFAALFAAAVGTASADPKITFTAYECMVCDQRFYGFPGDPSLDDKKFKDTPDQLKYIFKFVDYGSKNLNQCKNGVKTHIFDKKGTSSFSLSTLTRYRWAEMSACIKTAGPLTTSS